MPTVARRFHIIGSALLLGAAIGLAQAAAPASAPAPAMTVTRVYIVEVPPAEDHAFNEGVKAWNKCLHEHGFKRTSYVYDSETGDLTRYLFLNVYTSWAAMDTQDPAGKPCRSIFTTSVQPHASKAFSEVSVLNAKETYMPGGDTVPWPIMWVDAYRIKPGHGPAFNGGMAQFASAAAKTHWQGHFAGYDIEGGGNDAPDFVIAWPNKNWADVGTDPSPSVKDMMAGVYGAAAAESGHQKFTDAIAEHWSDAWSYDKDLSLTQGK